MFRLDVYSPFDTGKTSKYPTSPYVQFIVGWHGIDVDGRIYLSPQLMTDAEIDYQVQRLIGEVKEAGDVAKKMLRARHATIGGAK